MLLKPGHRFPMWSPFDRSAGKVQTPEQLEKAAARKRRLFEKAEKALTAVKPDYVPIAAKPARVAEIDPAITAAVAETLRKRGIAIDEHSS